MRSEKSALKRVFLQIKWNVQTITGNNLKKIMKLQSKENIDELDSNCVKGIFKYRPAPNEDLWRFSTGFITSKKLVIEKMCKGQCRK